MKQFIYLLIIAMLTSCIKSDETTDESSIPEGAIWKNQTIRRDTPVNGFAAIALWAQVATLEVNQSLSDTAVIEIDYWKIIEVLNGKESEIYFENYDYSYVKKFSIDEAGLYCRFPSWFDTSCHDFHSQVKNMSAYNGLLTIDVAQTPDSIIHWWTPKLLYKTGAQYIIEAKVKITGKTALQFGMDYWRTLTAGFNVFDPDCIVSNNCEAWISDWVLPTQGEFKTVRVPVR
jgi:hypothetical protein